MSTTSILDKPVPTKGKSRFAFLRTKRAIAALSLLVIISVVLIGKYDPPHVIHLSLTMPLRVGH